MQLSGANRRFLFLQGPHGPYFHRLGRMLTAAGAHVWRVGFNRGDRAFWPSENYIPYKGTLADWPQTFSALIADHAITDIVLYGDTRPIHAQAIAIARSQGLTVHVFEEGYLRPYWITYERGGARTRRRERPFAADADDRAADAKGAGIARYGSARRPGPLG